MQDLVGEQPDVAGPSSATATVRPPHRTNSTSEDPSGAVCTTAPMSPATRPYAGRSRNRTTVASSGIMRVPVSAWIRSEQTGYCGTPFDEPDGPQRCRPACRIPDHAINHVDGTVVRRGGFRDFVRSRGTQGFLSKSVRIDGSVSTAAEEHGLVPATGVIGCQEVLHEAAVFNDRIVAVREEHAGSGSRAVRKSAQAAGHLHGQLGRVVAKPGCHSEMA